MIVFTILKFIVMYGLAHIRLASVILPRIPVVPAIVVSAALSLYTWGHINGTKACLRAENTANLKMDKKNDKIKTKTDSLAHVALVKRLRKFTID